MYTQSYPLKCWITPVESTEAKKPKRSSSKSEPLGVHLASFGQAKGGWPSSFQEVTVLKMRTFDLDDRFEPGHPVCCCITTVSACFSYPLDHIGSTQRRAARPESVLRSRLYVFVTDSRKTHTILRILRLSIAGVGPDTFAGVWTRTKPFVFEGPDS